MRLLRNGEVGEMRQCYRKSHYRINYFFNNYMFGFLDLAINQEINVLELYFLVQNDKNKVPYKDIQITFFYRRLLSSSGRLTYIYIFDHYAFCKYFPVILKYFFATGSSISRTNERTIFIYVF